MGKFDSAVSRVGHKGKYYSLIPFFLESKLTAKKFVIKMELFPSAGFLRLHAVTMMGVQEIYMPIKEMVPVTPYDYWAASWLCFMKQHSCLDLDMVYANQNSKEMYVFDKYGNWHDEGVYHDRLSVE